VSLTLLPALAGRPACQALVQASLPLLPSMSPPQLVLTAEGLARCRHDLPREWLAAAEAATQAQLPSCG
jgi:hypothetical protein